MRLRSAWGPKPLFIVANVPWRQVRDLGNLLRHAYDKVDLEIIWQTITDDLPPLKTAVFNALRSGLSHMDVRALA